jgi:hypothetical protein
MAIGPEIGGRIAPTPMNVMMPDIDHIAHLHVEINPDQGNREMTAIAARTSRCEPNSAGIGNGDQPGFLVIGIGKGAGTEQESKKAQTSHSRSSLSGQCDGVTIPEVVKKSATSLQKENNLVHIADNDEKNLRIRAKINSYPGCATRAILRRIKGTIKAESDYPGGGCERQFVNNDSNDYKFTGKERG